MQKAKARLLEEQDSLKKHKEMQEEDTAKLAAMQKGKLEILQSRNSLNISSILLQSFLSASKSIEHSKSKSVKSGITCSSSSVSFQEVQNQVQKTL